MEWADGTNTLTYTYNGDDVRVGKSVSGSAITYLQDLASGLPVVVRETAGSTTTDYVRGVGLIAALEGSTVQYYHPDALGSTRLLTNGAGVVSDEYAYDAFGALRTHIGSSGQPFTYTGEQVDTATGLVFLRARYYDPGSGRFVSRDRFPALARQTQSINRYVYVENNPICFRDSSGRAWYDALNAEKNGVNDYVRKIWNRSGAGDAIIDNTPVVGELVNAAEGMEQYGKYRYDTQLDLITSEMTEDDQRAFEAAERASMRGLENALSSASQAAMEAPGTSLNPNYGLTSFLPEPVGNIVDLFNSPIEFLFGSLTDTIVDPVYDIPSLYTKHQFQEYYIGNTWYRNDEGWGGGGGGSWGTPPGLGK